MSNSNSNNSSQGGGVKLSYSNIYHRISDSVYSLKITSKTHGEFEVLIDSDCVEKCKQIHWAINKQTSRFVVTAHASGRKRIYLHRYLTDFKFHMVDHINGNPLDNRLENLREATPSKNQANRRNHKIRSKFLEGVMKAKTRFGSRIIYLGTPIYIGTFDTQLEAHEAYVKKHKELFGEFSKWSHL